ncbi:hypothetical protein SprV_0200939200 [Sparganum proliferum]
MSLWPTYDCPESLLPPGDCADYLRQRDNSSVSSEDLPCGSDPVRCLLPPPVNLKSTWRHNAPSLQSIVSPPALNWSLPSWSLPGQPDSVSDGPVSELSCLLRYSEKGPPLITGAERGSSSATHSNSQSGTYECELVPREMSCFRGPISPPSGEFLVPRSYPHPQSELMNPFYAQEFPYHRRSEVVASCPFRMPRTQTFGSEQKVAGTWSAPQNSPLWRNTAPFLEQKHVFPEQSFPQMARSPPLSPASHKRQKTISSRRVRCATTNTSTTTPQSTLASDLEVFAVQFKQRRMKLGITQADVGKALGRLNIPGLEGLSQSTICRFESLTLSHTNMQNLQPILQLWLDTATCALESPGASSISPPRPLSDLVDQQPSASPGAGKRRRACITDSERRSLEAYFSVQPQPSGEQIAQISILLGLKRRVVRVWFCNQRQKQKRLKFLSGLASGSSAETEPQIASSQSGISHLF